MRLIAAALFATLISPGVSASTASHRESSAIEVAVNAYFRRAMPYVKNGLFHSQTAFVTSPTTRPWSEADRDAYEMQNTTPADLRTLSLSPALKVRDLNAFGTFEEFSWDAFKKTYGDSAVPIRVARPLFRDGGATVRFETVSESEIVPGTSQKSIPVDVVLEQAGDTWRIVAWTVNP